CDSLNIDGTTKPSTQDRGTYGHAQKMRASMTYAFGRLNGLGNMPWHESDAGGGLMVGNPSISVEVSSYMCSLHRRKVQAGEVANSAHAITSDILLKLYHHNHLAHNWTIRKYQPGERGQSGLDLWGGGRVWRLLQAAYTVSFLCMLHFDEVLKIQVHDLRAHEDRMVLHLPFRKTHQNGEIKLFHLWSLPSCEAHICPVRALAAWLSESKITSGYLFRKIVSGDRIAEANSQMVSSCCILLAVQIPDARRQSSEQFLELFRNNLLDINIDPAPYGTHSFRRGGCQYLHVEKRWPLRRICEWGGWSAEFSNLTIVKYLISSNDDPAEPQEHFFDPNRPPRVKCPQCGRCCACA
ncbi:DNA breaking-rejoining enzyme, partial [Suillus subluteus]